ncbi:MAG: toprim domain-containing protein [Bacteroidales bacterium]
METTLKTGLIIPLHDAHNRIVGFVGRSLTGEDPKYFNSRGTDLYKKGSLLFGLNFAAHEIKRNESAYLVEGNADVIKMHQLGYTNTVGSCGTALTRDQILILKKICNSITIIPDNDGAGKTACDKSAKMILTEGMNCNIIHLPDSKEKSDADSFFTDADHFKEYAHDNVQDYIIGKASRWSQLPKSPEITRRAIDEVSALIYQMDPSVHDLYIDQVSKLIKPKKACSI